jgi:PBP1b-binding outer membrane lipoprotein LpoB
MKKLSILLILALLMLFVAGCSVFGVHSMTGK